MNNELIGCWWSAGITSAVACKIAIEKYPNIKLMYIETGSAHPDNSRFKSECEKWYGLEIETYKAQKYKSHFDVIYKTGYINGPDGAPCTLKLKKEVRYRLQEEFNFSNQVFGFELDKKEVNRAIRFIEQYPETKPIFPLIESKISKVQAFGILFHAGIKAPKMYELGYSNNNCIGCVKGGMGYWNKVRQDFPMHYGAMAVAERNIGHSCIKGVFLDELEEDRGHKLSPIIPDCDLFCQVEFADIIDPRTEKIMSGELSIKDVA